MEQIEFIKSELAARDNLMHQMAREREEFRQQLALIRGGTMNAEQASSESRSFSSRRLSQHRLFSEMSLPAMSTSKSVPVACCFQAMPAVSVPTCASMSVSLGVPVNIVKTSEQIGGFPGAEHVRNGASIESRALCEDGMEQISGNYDTYSFDGDLNMLPKYDGVKKGLTARLWLKSVEEVRTLYRLKKKQMVPLTRFLCTGLARE
jgi:hypothetical protein